ncbi:MAG: aminotransferase class I/II-fold pyridoxal phosphate-dependent enzyme, partial [Burkholderiales bacterium]|nr:aminotransferase class I/II-fold pyridoxal phosphate-dependent enzyme [Burkholderiales bacterium]
MGASPKSPQALVREEILALKAYHVAPAAGMVKLDAMENPYGLPEDLRAEIGELAVSTALNRYPDPTAPALRERLRAAFDIPAECELLLGNGSDEIITMVTQTLARPGAVMLAPEPSFAMYRMNAIYSRMRYVGVPLKRDFGLDTGAFLAAIEEHRPALVFIAYPNNPTGNLFPERDVEAIIEAAPGFVVIDEAYHAFAGKSFMDRLARYPNLMVMRTVSK